MITQSTTNSHISLIFKVLTIHSVVVANRTISIAILNAPTRFLHKVFRPCAIPPQQSGGATGETKPGATRSRTAPLKSDNGGNAHRTTPEKNKCSPRFSYRSDRNFYRSTCKNYRSTCFSGRCTRFPARNGLRSGS